MNWIIVLIRRMTFNKVFILLFLFIYCGLYYQEYAIFISLSYLLLGFAFVFNIVKHRGLIHVHFIIVCVLFFLYSIFSALWADDFSQSYNAAIQLGKSSLVAACFITLIDSKEHFKWALFVLSLSGVVYALLYFQNVDITSLGANRIMTEGDNEFLPNVNTVSLIVSISFSYYIYMYFLEKNNWFLGLAGLAFIMIFFLGSRKSIISIFICAFLIFFKLNGKSKTRLLLLFALLIVLLLFYIPRDYLNFVSERLAMLNFLASNVDNLDSSDEIRIRFVEYGLKYSMDSPIIGNGYYSFSHLFGRDFGTVMYSHNNFIETFVGGGLVGFMIYYSLHFYILRNISVRNIRLDFGYLLLILLVVMLFNDLGIVVLQDRFIWVLLAVLFTGSGYYKYSS